MRRLLRSKSLIFDIYGAFIRPRGGWIAVSDLITLLGAVGIDEQAVRSSVSRFRQKDLLVREVIEGDVGYRLSDHAEAILAEGDVRIFNQQEPATLQEGWTLATFSVPENLRAERHQLRTRLTWLGFGNLGSGVWIAPRRALARAVAAVEELGLTAYVVVFAATYEAFDDLESLIQRCWDVNRMRSLYATYLDDFEPVRARWQKSDPNKQPEEAFADYIAALHEWRKIPYTDPGLPRAVLPDDWEGKAAYDLFDALRALLEPAATEFVSATVSERAGTVSS
jgi:phenylacetic acid degradation operon negative regulatory protein